MNSQASREKLEALWAAFLGSLGAVVKTKDTPSVELLNVVRLFLKDNSVKASQEQLESLHSMHKLLATKLLSAVSSQERPSPTAMETARRFLLDNSITKDVSTALAIRQGLETLSDLSLPFNPAKAH